MNSRQIADFNSQKNRAIFRKVFQRTALIVEVHVNLSIVLKVGFI